MPKNQNFVVFILFSFGMNESHMILNNLYVNWFGDDDEEIQWTATSQAAIEWMVGRKIYRKCVRTRDR